MRSGAKAGSAGSIASSPDVVDRLAFAASRLSHLWGLLSPNGGANARSVGNDDGVAARRFHQATKHSLESIERDPHMLDWENLPLPFKIYRGLPVLPLPSSRAPSGMSAIDAITGIHEIGRAHV